MPCIWTVIGFYYDIFNALLIVQPALQPLPMNILALLMLLQIIVIFLTGIL